MKKTSYTLYLISCLFLVYKLGFAMGGIAVLMTGLVLYLLINRIEYLQNLLWYGNVYEDIVVMGCHPKTGKKPIIDLDCPIIYVEHDKVMLEVQNQIEWLTKANNQFYCDPSLTEDQKLKVIPIIFQDGKYINETWKQYNKRGIEEIKPIRSKRHEMLKKIDPVWYAKYSNNQRNVEWVKKN